MSQRTEQMNELIRGELSRLILEKIEFPSDMLVTITRVSVTPNLKNADIYISVLPDGLRGSALKLLRKQSSNIRHTLAQHLVSRTTPKLFFKVDEKESYVSEIDSIIDIINKND